MLGVGMLSGIASGGAGGGGGGLQMASSATSSLSDRSPINIVPTAFNLGAIMQPYAQGSPENGGIGADYMPRYSGYGGSQLTAGGMAKSNMLMYVLLASGGLLAAFLLMR